MKCYKLTVKNKPMSRPKTKPESYIYPIRHEKALIARLRKRHGAELHEYLKQQMTAIDKSKRIPSPDAD